MADDVLLREQVWGFRGMPVLAHPLYTPPVLYAEVLRANLVMNRSISHLRIVNLSVDALGVVNRIVTDTYDELEEL